MSLFRSKWATGFKMMAVSGESRGVVCERLKFTVDEDLSIGDVIEIGGLPAYHFPVDAILINEALGAGVTLDVGIASGDYGEDDDSRTAGDEMFDGVDVSAAAVNRMSLATGFQIDHTDEDRGIGLTVGGSGVTASGQEIELLLFYVQ